MDGSILDVENRPITCIAFYIYIYIKCMHRGEERVGYAIPPVFIFYDLKSNRRGPIESNRQEGWTSRGY